MTAPSGFILNLENLEKLLLNIQKYFLIFMKSQERCGIVREFSIILIQVRKKSGKANYLVSILFSLTIDMVVRQVIALIFVSRCKLYHFAL